MSKTNKEIIEEINAHIKKCGGVYSSWYVGIAANAKERLLAHKVDKEAYIYRTASSSQDARQIERYFTETSRSNAFLIPDFLISKAVFNTVFYKTLPIP